MCTLSGCSIQENFQRTFDSKLFCSLYNLKEWSSQSIWDITRYDFKKGQLQAFIQLEVEIYRFESFVIFLKLNK